MSKIDIVNFNVGGTVFMTTKDTLRQSQYLSTIVQGDWNEKSQEQIFIDRDSFLFRYILLYLRTGECDVENKHLHGLLLEAEFYCLPDLSKRVEQMISDNNKKELTEAPKERVFRLLTQAEFDGIQNINIANSLVSILERRVTACDVKLITSITCLQKLFNCPKQIACHNRPGICGRACKKAQRNNHETYVYRDINMYLVSLLEDPKNAYLY